MNATGVSTATAAFSAAAPSSERRTKLRCSVGSDFPTTALSRPVLHELPPEPALHAQIADRDRIVERRRRFHYHIVLYMQRQRASDTAVRTNRVGLRLPGFVPRAGAEHVVLRFRHQRAGRADR